MSIYSEAPTITIGVDAYAKTTYADTVLATKVSKIGDIMTELLAMGSNKITGVADPTGTQDAATKNYVDTISANKVSKSGDTMTGILVMGRNKIINVVDPTRTQDAATKDYVDLLESPIYVITSGTIPTSANSDIILYTLPAKLVMEK